MPAFASALSALPEIPEPEEGEDPNFDIAIALDEEGAGEPPEDPPAAPPAAPEPEDDPEPEDAPADDLSRKAADYDAFVEAYQANPKAFLKQLSEGLGPDEIAEVFGVASSLSDDGWTDDDLSNASDFFVREHRQHIAALPQFQQQVESDLNTVGNYMSQLAYQNAALEAQIAILTEATKVTLPEIDPKAISALVAKGKTYKQAFDETYVKEAKRVSAAAKAKAEAQASLPRTPRDAGVSSAVDTADLSKKPKVGLNDLAGIARQMLAQQNASR